MHGTDKDELLACGASNSFVIYYSNEFRRFKRVSLLKIYLVTQEYRGSRTSSEWFLDRFWDDAGFRIGSKLDFSRYLSA
jgi:hypothetical protein